MRLLVVALSLAGCADSAEENLERFWSDAKTECWHNSCPGYPQSPPNCTEETPSAQGIACMNDALANDIRARSSCVIYSFREDTEYGTYVFSVDGRVKVFTTTQLGPNPREVREWPTCRAGFLLTVGSLCTWSAADCQ